MSSYYHPKMSSYWHISFASAFYPDLSWNENPWRTYPISDWLVDFYELADSPKTGLNAVIRYRNIWENEKSLDLLHDEKRFEKWCIEQSKKRKTINFRAELEAKLNTQEYIRHNNLETHKYYKPMIDLLFGYRKPSQWYFDLSEMKIKRGEKLKNDTLVCRPAETTSKYLDRPKANTIIKT